MEQLTLWEILEIQVFRMRSSSPPSEILHAPGDYVSDLLKTDAMGEGLRACLLALVPVFE